VGDFKEAMIIALFAIDAGGGIGNNGAMPWPALKEDLKWFKDTTKGHVVVMGKKTWLSPDMPKPLPKRHNVVFTNEFMDNDDIFQLKGDVCAGLVQMQENNTDMNVFVIGGANLLMQSKPVLEAAYITRIKDEYFCDTKLDMTEFLIGFSLVETIDLGTCKVEKYEAI
jgi:dihydrofolate reductase